MLPPFLLSTARRRVCLLALIASGLLAACSADQTASSTPTHPGPTFAVVRQAGLFTVSGVAGDEQQVEDVADALQVNAPQITQTLEFDYQEPVRVELFPNQDSLDQFGMNPEMIGFYAYSGEHRIQMVSPRNAPLTGYDPGYSQRVLIAVHEFVHLVNNAINEDMPDWLNEGAAIYVGPHDIYAYVCQHQFPFDQIPSLTDLEERYEAVRAADLFAYSVIDFIAADYGLEAVNALLRRPDALEEVVGLTRAEFEQQWRIYMNAHYANQP